MMLNEMRDGDSSLLSPTDSRLRPDIRKMEEGDIGASTHLVSYNKPIIKLNLYLSDSLRYSYLEVACSVDEVF